MKEVTKTIYEADDGTIFQSQKECEAYEKKLRAEEATTTYWRVRHNPDLTEGRGMYGLTLFKVRYVQPYNALMYAQDWCYRKYGRPIAFVQGVAPTENWNLQQITKEDFNNERLTARVGDYNYPAKRYTLRPGPHEDGLIEES